MQLGRLSSDDALALAHEAVGVDDRAMHLAARNLLTLGVLDRDVADQASAVLIGSAQSTVIVELTRPPLTCSIFTIVPTVVWSASMFCWAHLEGGVLTPGDQSWGREDLEVTASDRC